MAFSFSVSDPVVFWVICGIAAILIISGAVLYLKKSKRTGTSGTKTPGQKKPRLDYQPEIRPIPAVPQKTVLRPVQKSAVLPRPKEISLLNGKTDITQSLLSLVEKYSLDQFTIATSDGLVFASNGAETAQDDAARYVDLYTNNPDSDIPGVVLRGISHKGSDLVLIIRTALPVPEETRQSIENDTKDILNWWI